MSWPRCFCIKFSAAFSSYTRFSPARQSCHGVFFYSARRSLYQIPDLINDDRYEHFFRYTSGRWLWNEAQQLRDRYTRFNVSELQKIAAKSVKAKECISMVKIAEGAFNKIFRLVMDNGTVAIARIPTAVAGPAYYTTASEVATMDFVRSVLKVPAPEIYAWNARADSPVGAEYIIMEEVSGTKVEDVWESLDIEDRISITEELVSIQSKLLSISFKSYGNLYFSNEAIPGAVAAEVASNAPPDVKEDVRNRYSIGPVVKRTLWSDERVNMHTSRGPWRLPQDYVVAVGNCEKTWIKKHAVSKKPEDPFFMSMAQNSPDAHTSLLDKYLKTAPYLLPADPELIASTIWHTDLHGGNIFMENKRITSIIDWQGAWAGPLVLQAQQPSLVNHQGDIILETPDNYKTLEPDEQLRLKRQMASSIVLYLYETTTRRVNPIIHKIFHLKLVRVRCQLVVFAGSTWDDNILRLRESLIKLERYWGELELNIPCPIHFTEDELQNHSIDGEGFNDIQEFWQALESEGIARRDGWTQNETFDETVALFRGLREYGLKTKSGNSRKLFEAQTRWVEEIPTKMPAKSIEELLKE